MELEARKIKFVRDFLDIEKEESLLRFEKLLEEEKQSLSQEMFSPMSIEEFNDRIDESIRDSKEGRLTEASDLKARIAKWR